MKDATKLAKIIFIIVFSLLILELLISMFILKDIRITTFFIVAILLILIAKKAISCTKEKVKKQ